MSVGACVFLHLFCDSSTLFKLNNWLIFGTCLLSTAAASLLLTFVLAVVRTFTALLFVSKEEL